MLLGIVSDTHNNLKNIDNLIAIFNSKRVDLVIHTGDITNARSLEQFSKLKCGLLGAYGNNDRNEIGLDEVASKNGFIFKEPPHIFCMSKRNVAIFHEPEPIENFLNENQDIDIILHGHTHRYREEIKNRTLIFNPGESAGIQKGKNAVGIINLDCLSAERIFF